MSAAMEDGTGLPPSNPPPPPPPRVNERRPPTILIAGVVHPSTGFKGSPQIERARLRGLSRRRCGTGRPPSWSAPSLRRAARSR